MKTFFLIFFLIGFSYSMQAQCGAGTDVGGTVYIDIPANAGVTNTYGVKDANELGLIGVSVVVTDINGTLQITTTDINGDWSISAPVFPVKVEFSWPQSWLKESPFGLSENSSLRLISGSDCNVNFGLLDPNSYIQNATPDYVNNVRVSGSSIGNALSSLETTHYNDNGLSSDFNQYDGTQGVGPTSTTDATFGQLGSTWGKTFQTSKQRLFVTSAAWRHVGFAAGKGLGDIFVFDYNNGSPATMLGSIDLQGVMPANGGAAIDLSSICRGGGCENDPGNTGILADYELPADPTTPSVDLDAFAKVGKVSYGGIAYDANNDKIWIINLNQKAIIEIDGSGDFASLPGAVNQYLMSSLPNVPVCAGGALRPWAITVHDGKGYVGCLCDGSISQVPTDMDAYVVSFDLNNPTAGFTTEFTIPLDYDKNGTDWHAWSDIDQSTGGNWKRYAQPILSDIEFDELNNMYLAFMDRWGLQAGYSTNPPISGSSSTSEKAQCDGELFKVCNNAGSYELEGTGTCPVNYPTTSEFFNDKAGDNHSEGAGGALAIVLGSNQLLVQIVDPHPEETTGQPYWSTQGQNTMSTINGSIENWYSNIYSGSTAYNGKGVGMGDIELLAEAAPVEVGNLVWNDTNGNGIQDAGEPGIGNVAIELLDASSTVLAQATTDANGFYIFSNNPNGTTTPSTIYNVTGLSFGQPYVLRITNANGNAQQGVLSGLAITQNDNGTNIHDSDATLSGNDAQIAIVAGDIPSIGTGNHSFDFGFKLADFDWGDLPDLAAGTAIGDYESLAANNGPRHIIDPSIQLGLTNTIETDAQQNTNADGDVDDGLTLSGNENWVPGATLHIPLSATNTTGATANLEAWIDWNADGDFNDANEMVLDIDDAASFPSSLAIIVPANAVHNQKIGFRVRLSNTNNMTPYGEVFNGEVEDYMITVSCSAAKCLPTTVAKY